MIQPFRWNIQKRNELGTLINEGSIQIDEKFINELALSAARIIAFSDDSRLYFIGRSPENYFDFLNGIYRERKFAALINLFQYSEGRYDMERLRKNEVKLSYLREQMKSIGLSPKVILENKRSTALVDVVYTGSTMKNLIENIRDWTIYERLDWKSVRSKIRIVGITFRTKNSPNTWRWQQQTDAKRILEGIKVKNVSITWGLWNEIGNTQSKVTTSNSPNLWDSDKLEKPIRLKEHLEGLNFAYALNQLAGQKEIRELLKLNMQKQIEMKYKWFREWYDNI